MIKPVATQGSVPRNYVKSYTPAKSAHTSASSSVTSGLSHNPVKTLEEAAYAQLRSLVGDAANKLGYSDVMGIDTSPEATSDRIVSFGTSMFGLYQRQNPDLSESDALEKFESLIRGAVDTGFNDAIQIIRGLGAMSSEVDTVTSKTYELIHSKLDDWFSSTRARLEDPAEESPELQSAQVET